LSILEIKNLTFGYTKERLIFDNFSLSVGQGEIVSVVGPSGIGKSTLFDLIAGFLEAKSGTIEAPKISFVFQDPYASFSDNYSIREQIMDVALEIDEELLKGRLALDPSLLDKKPFELSGGQLQRMSIFRCLMMKPELILADEPTSALDNITKLEVMKLFVSLIDKASILMITHDMELARWASDRVVGLGE
jgi:peptide/nickel transport system ATP-binding protein